MDQGLKIVATADGSNTIYNAEVGENYHSSHGALQESEHVFLRSGLEYFLELPFSPDNDHSKVSILEVGFGTGLNFLLTADFCIENNIELNYTGIEAYPLSKEMISQTGYSEYVSSGLWRKFIADYSLLLSGDSSIINNCKLYVAYCKLSEFSSADQYDIIYFDAFASARQPEMWDNEAIAHTLRLLKPGGIFVTYAITGNLKRALKALGCKVEKAPGAPGKREMLRAVKTAFPG